MAVALQVASSSYDITYVYDSVDFISSFHGRVKSAEFKCLVVLSILLTIGAPVGYGKYIKVSLSQMSFTYTAQLICALVLIIIASLTYHFGDWRYSSFVFSVSALILIFTCLCKIFLHIVSRCPDMYKKVIEKNAGRAAGEIEKDPASTGSVLEALRKAISVAGTNYFGESKARKYMETLKAQYIDSKIIHKKYKTKEGIELHKSVITDIHVIANNLTGESPVSLARELVALAGNIDEAELSHQDTGVRWFIVAVIEEAFDMLKDKNEGDLYGAFKQFKTKNSIFKILTAFLINIECQAKMTDAKKDYMDLAKRFGGKLDIGVDDVPNFLSTLINQYVWVADDVQLHRARVMLQSFVKGNERGSNYHNFALKNGPRPILAPL